MILGDQAPVTFLAFASVATVIAYPVLAILTFVLLSDSIPAWIARLRPSRLLSPMPILGLVLLFGIVIQVPSFIKSDTYTSTDIVPSVICASRSVLAGHDPYELPELQCLREMHIASYTSTPLRAGPFRGDTFSPSRLQVDRYVHRINPAHPTVAFPEFGYPPMAFVWMLPVASGAHSLWTAWILLALGLWLFAVLRISGKWWPAVIFVVLGQIGMGALTNAAIQGDAEFFAYAFMALALFLIDAPRRSGVALGIAVATNPLAWVMAPAYLLFTRTLPGFRQRLSWLGGTMIITVGPWVLIYHDAMKRMVDLVIQPEFPLGIGIVSLALFAPHLPLLAKSLYTGGFAFGEFGILALGLWKGRYLPAVVVMSIALLWISWRSNSNYLVQLPLLACGMTIGLERVGWTSGESP